MASCASLLGDAETEESDEEEPDVILDYDREGNVIGREVLSASTRVSNPRAMDYAVAGQGPLPLPSLTPDP